MIDYGKTRSTMKPLDVEITQTRVFTASNIHSITEPSEDNLEGFSGFEFDLTEYTIEEYIKLQAEKNSELSSEVTNTQLALCEIYEALAARGMR